MLRFRPLVLLLLVGAPLALVAQQPAGRPAQNASSTAPGSKLITPRDMAAWKSIRNATLSADGRWFAYVAAPNEGDAELVVRPTADGGKETRYPIGEPSGGAGGGFGGPFGRRATGGPVQISEDGKWLAFTIYPTHREAERARQQRRPAQNKAAVVNLASGEKKEFERVRTFSFAGDAPTWIALHTYPADAAPAAGNGGGAAAPGAGGGGGAAAASRPQGTDLLLYRLTNGEALNVGNVADFSFDRTGAFLAYTIDARDHIGNGVQLRNLKTDVVRALDSDAALYRRLSWIDSGFAFTVLRGKPDTVAKDTAWAVLAFTNVDGSARATVFDPKGVANFPSGMEVSADRAPSLSTDMSTIFFGIREAPKPAPKTIAERGNGNRPSLVQAGAPGAGGTVNQPRTGPETEDETPSLILWHWKDPRLQSQQIVQEGQDKQYSYLSEYRIAEKKFVRLSDDSLRQVNLMPKEQYAYGIDTREYEQPASYSGRRYLDVYRVDLKTGARTMLLEKHHSFTIPSPDGRQLLYWGKDGHYWVADLATGEKRNITKDVATSFVDTEDDHNNLYPPAINPMQAGLGWSNDGSTVLLFDNWDIWKVPVKGGAAVNLTVDGKRNQIRYQRRYSYDPDEKGIDLSKPLYVAMYGEWTKKEGLARIDPGKAGATTLVFDDAKYGFSRADKANTWMYTRQTFQDYPDWYVASTDLKSGRKITDANPQQKEFAWSSGTRLVDYVSDKGDKLQGTMYLPANFDPSKKYPMLVTIYEKRSQNRHVYTAPSETRTPDPSIYTNRGYIVFDPDIVYRVNDPGMSAVWCVVPAVKAAIATGIVDASKVGLWGHSWGGYQTAFLVTQTDIFAAAIAGAPLTDMVSMYSSIYWNTGGANQAIFESSQGRFKGNFIDNYDAYIRNSPAFHAKNVKTPLVILHNDKDGAVDFNQGITYYNTLRQLGKDVILLEYVGENHGLRRPVNQKDYAVRMGQWFDHFLEEKPAPEWITDGIPRLKMEQYLKDLRDMNKAQKTEVVP